MAKQKYSPNEIPDINADWGEDTTDEQLRPFSGGAVQKFIKKTMNGKVGYRYEDTDNDLYLFFADQASCETYLTDPDTHSDLLLWTSPMQKAYTAEIYLSSPTSVSILSGTTGQYLDFTFDVKNRQGASSGDSVVVRYTFSSDSGSSKTVTEIYDTGTSVHFCIDEYLTSGTNRIQIALSGRTTLAATSQSVVYNVVSLSCNAEFDITKVRDKGEQFVFNITAEGSGTKYIETYLDGNSVTASDDYITALSGVISKIITLPSDITDGVHNIQVRAYITSGGNNYYTKVQSFDFAVKGGTAVLVLFKTTIDEPSSTVSLSATQYETTEITYAIYDPNNTTIAITFSDGEETIANRSLTNGETDVVEYTPITSGSKTITATASGMEYTLPIVIAASSISMSKATAGLIAEFSARGRSNSDANKSVWKSGSYTAKMTDVQYNAQCGWVDNALVLSGSATVEFDVKPLASNAATSGVTIEIDYSVDNGNSDDEATIMDLTNTNGDGVYITPTYVKVKSSDSKYIKHLRMTGVRKKMAVIINRNTIDANKGIFLTMANGQFGYSENYTASTPFSVNKTIKIGDTSGTCTVRLYCVRIYSRALSVEEELGNYAVDSGEVISVANRNDVLINGTTRPSFDKTKLKVASMRIIGDIQKLLSVQDKKTSITAVVEFYDPSDITKYWKADNVVIKNQGTSTLKFPIKNFSFNFTASKWYDMYGNEVSMSGIQLHSKSYPVKKAVAKCDYMESSSSMNTSGAISFNDTGFNTKIDDEYKLRSAAQNYAVSNGISTDIRTAIDGIGIAMFYKQTDESDEVCLGQYNLNNGKDDCPEAYGFEGMTGYDSSNTERWELAEEDGLCLFTAASFTNFDSTYGSYFECVFPSEDHSPAQLKRLVGWLAGLDNGDGTYDQDKFDSEYTQYLDPWKTAHYYNHIFIKNMGVDQGAKNMHLVTEDGSIWYPVYYDGDSAKLNDNDGYQFDECYDKDGNKINPLYADRQAKDEHGNYLFQAHDSVLWNCIEGSDSFMSILRQEIAAEYSHGFNYDTEVKTYITEHTALFPERIINQNAEAKYLSPYRSGSANYLYVSQGIKDERIRLIADRRLKRYEALWVFGGYASRALNFRLNTGNTVADGKIKVTAFSDYWFAYSSNLNMVESGIHLAAGESYSFTAGSHANGDILRIHATDQMSELDMSELMTGLYSIEATNTYSSEGSTHLAKLVVSDGVNENTTVNQINGLNKLTALEYLDIRNYKGITSIERLPLLKTILASGSSLASFHPADGSTLEKVSLPETISDIEIKDASVTEFDYTPTAKLTSLKITGTTGIDTYAFVTSWVALLSDEQKAAATLELTNVNWSTTADVLFGIAKIGTMSLRGVIEVSDDMTMDLYNQLIATFGPSVFSSTSVLYIKAKSATILSADKTSISSGDSVQFSSVVIPYLTTPVYRMYVNGERVEEVDGYANYNGASLNCSTGKMTTSRVHDDFSIQVSAFGDSIESNKIEISIAHTIAPTEMSIEGSSDIIAVGDNEYTLKLTPSDYTIGVTNIEITITEE